MEILQMFGNYLCHCSCAYNAQFTAIPAPASICTRSLSETKNHSNIQGAFARLICIEYAQSKHPWAQRNCQVLNHYPSTRVIKYIIVLGWQRKPNNKTNTTKEWI